MESDQIHVKRDGPDRVKKGSGLIFAFHVKYPFIDPLDPLDLTANIITPYIYQAVARRRTRRLTEHLLGDFMG